ncbi:hypothetical protein F5148DRAFT_1379945, partial [Russula earlei]
TALAFLVWDIVITIDQEVDAVWSKPNGQDSCPPLLRTACAFAPISCSRFLPILSTIRL